MSVVGTLLWRETWSLLAVLFAFLHRPLVVAVALTFAVMASLAELTQAVDRERRPRSTPPA